MITYLSSNESAVLAQSQLTSPVATETLISNNRELQNISSKKQLDGRIILLKQQTEGHARRQHLSAQKKQDHFEHKRLSSNPPYKRSNTNERKKPTAAYGLGYSDRMTRQWNQIANVCTASDKQQRVRHNMPMKENHRARHDIA